MCASGDSGGEQAGLDLGGLDELGEDPVESLGLLRRQLQPRAVQQSWAWATGSSASITRPPIAASTLRSSACAQTPPNMPSRRRSPPPACR